MTLLRLYSRFRSTFAFQSRRIASGVLLVAGFLAASGTHAQSTMTLYGIIDTGITYVNNQQGHAAWRQSANNINGTRWGFRGSEDLGGGYAALFVLENGFSVSTGALGQNGREFGRQAYVGVRATRAGRLTLGRQYDSVVDYVGPLALTGTSYGGIQFAHPFDNDNLDNSFRISNSAKWESREYGGLKFGGLYGFSNQAGAFADNRAFSVGASYRFGPLKAGAAFLQIDRPGAANNTSGALTSDATFVAARQRIWGAGVNYAFGRASAGVVYTHTQANGATEIGAYASGTSTGFALAEGDIRFDNVEVNARYALTDAFTVSGAYTYTDGRIDGRNAVWNQANLLASYGFSRRTDVYLMAVYQHVRGLDGTGIGAGISGLSHASGNEQVAATVGIRHRF